MMMLGVLKWLHFFIFFLCSSFNLHIVTASSSRIGYTNETDQQALLAVRSQITEDPLGALSSWNASIHFCRWQGVACGRRHQRVVSLDLSSLKIVGQLSPHVGNLSFLRSINLENNTFQGTIPQELGRLYRLQNLDLWNNSFRGEIPLNLTNCRHLRELVLVNNQLGGQIPAELGSLSRLQGLGLSGNNFVGIIPPSLGNLSTLSLLSIHQTHIEGNIPVEFGQLSNLQFLILSANQLSGSIPKQLFNISSIRSLSLTENHHIEGELPSNLCFNTPNLQGLYLGRNILSGLIPPSLTNCSALAELSMDANSFTGQIPVGFERLQNLETLSLDTNRLEVPTSATLGLLITSLANCTNLNYLTLLNNNLRGSLPKSIGNLSSSLTMLRLGGNPITGRIPSEIGNLAGLQTLSLQETKLFGHIPSSIGKLYNLRAIRLYSTKISGEIPPSLGNITYLSRLYIASNLLQGSIPESLGNCSYLEVLNLEQNQLTGGIPKKVVQLSSLTLGLSLAGNHLVGPLPSEVSKLTNVNFLNFSNNKLSGRIPLSLESCQVLEVLDISGNLLDGDIPYSLKKMRGIQILDVSRNNLSGQIPDFLGEITLTSLNLSYNNFEGKVPTTGVFKNVSAFSIIANGKLCGGIKELKLPECPRKVSKKKTYVSRKVIIIVSCALFIIFVAVCLFLIKHRMRKSKEKPSSPSLFKERHQRLSYSTLFDSTNGFSSANIIGKGRYGTVYKGILPDDDEQMVAVKVFNLQERRADKTFSAECETLKAIRHRNLVKIITACSSIDFQGNDFKALVFEFMPNGNLHSWLHPSLDESHEPRKLNLIQRLDISIDIASALLYIHIECDTMMVHCDLKPSNILLDNDLKACVSDFGLTKSLSMVRQNSSHAQSSSTGVRGTMGYIAPEYGIGEGVSTSGDMYSFGILLMELFTGKSPTENEFTEDMSLHEYVKMALPQGVTEIVDPVVLDEESIRHGKQESVMEGLVSVLQIGLACSMDSPKERMNIKQAFKELQKTRDMLIKSVFSQQMRRGGLSSKYHRNKDSFKDDS